MSVIAEAPRFAKLPYDGSVWGGVSVSHGYVLVGTVSGKLYCYTVPGRK